MTALRQLTVGVALVATLVAAGAVEARSVGQVIDDTAITTQVKARLTADRLSNLTKIEVTTNDGTVTLAGVVEEPERKARAAEIVGTVTGVKGVVNNIHVAGSTVSATPLPPPAAPTPGTSVSETPIDATGVIASVDPTVPVIFLDTGKHFPETLAYRDELARFLGLRDLRIITPDPEVIARKDETGLRWSYDPDGCCEIRKVIPLERALLPFDASITGRKAFQASTRNALPRFELDTTDSLGRLKFNPLSTWTKDDIEEYFEKHALPRHPLEAEGYLSIGCAPCTSMVKPGEDPRAGRWRGWDKTECGIHTPITDDNDPNLPAF